MNSAVMYNCYGVLYFLKNDPFTYNLLLSGTIYREVQ